MKVNDRHSILDLKPDITTPRTDVYITGLEEKDLNDPFYQD